MDNDNKINYGIELLRITSMLFVVILHTLGHGGILNSIDPDQRLSYGLVWLIEIVAYCAVDIFALISGYVGSNKSSEKSTHVVRKMISLWGVVLFYSLFCALICRIIIPEKITFQEIIKSFFPLSNGLYWYFNAYIVAFCFFPLINKAINGVSDKILVEIVVLLGFVFPFYELLCGEFKLLNGYSAIWLIILYLIGAYLKKSECSGRFSKKYCLFVICISAFSIWIWKVYGIEFKINPVSFEISKSTLVSYLSPLVLIASISYLLFFSALKIENRKMKRIISICGKGSFAIYLLNDNFLIREKIITGSFVKWASDPPFLMLLKILGFAVAFVLVSIVIDILRRQSVVFIKNVFLRQLNNH